MFDFFGSNDEEDTQQIDPALEEFNSAARTVFNEAPDVETGLATLKELYTGYDFQDKKVAADLFTTQSDSVRQRFDDTKPFDVETSFEYSPVDLAEIVPEGEDDETKRIDHINQWEQKSLSALKETDDPNYLQIKSQLTRGIQQAATLKRREIYSENGDESYLDEIVDLGTRAAQGSIGGLASLVGVDSVNDWFTERTDADNDKNWTAVIAQGAGSVIPAIGLATVSGGASLAYLGASGAGSVVQKVRDSIENEGTPLEAVAAGTVEGISQAGQTVVGAKIFGGVGAKLAGKATEEVGTTLGARVYSVGKSALQEGSTEAAGQVLSNVADNLGNVADTRFTAGVGESFVVGGILAGGSTAAGDFVSSRRKTPEQELRNTIVSIEGTPPPVSEGKPAQPRRVDINAPAATVAELEDGNKIVQVNGKLHLKVGDNHLEAYDEAFNIDPEVAVKLKNLKHTPDGKPIIFTVEDNKLYIESENVNPDLTINPQRTGKTKVQVPTSTSRDGSNVFFVDRVREENGVRTARSFLVDSPIKASGVGASSATMKPGAFGRMQTELGYQESEFVTRLRAKLGDERSEALGLSVSDADGNVTPLLTYLPKSNPESFSESDAFVEEKGIPESIAYLASLERFNKQDQAIINTLDGKISRAIINARNAGDEAAVETWSEVHQDLIAQDARVSNEGGSIMQLRTDKGRTATGASLGDVQVVKIDSALRKKAKARIKEELGVDKSATELKKEAAVAQEQLAAVQKEVNDPVEIELSDIDTAIAEITQKAIETEVDAPIKKYQTEIKELENRIAKEESGAGENIVAAKKQISEAIADTETQIKEVETEIKGVTEKSPTPTKAQLNTQKNLETRIATLTKREAALKKSVEQLSKDNDKLTVKQKESAAKKAEAAKAEVERVAAKIEETKQTLEIAKEEIQSRVNTPKKPTSAQTKKLNELRKKLTEFKKEFELVEKSTPANNREVKRFRSLIQERKDAIADLEKQRAIPRKLTPRQAQLEKRKSELSAARDTGRIKIAPEAKAKLDKATATARAAADRAAKAARITEENLSKFSREDADNLTNWYNELQTMPEGIERRKLAQAIFDVESKYLETAQQSNALFDFYRGNLLSGMVTQVRNFVGNTSNLASNLASTAVTGTSVGRAAVRVATLNQLKIDPDAGRFSDMTTGVMNGIVKGIKEAKEILSGNLKGRSNYSDKSSTAPETETIKADRQIPGRRFGQDPSAKGRAADFLMFVPEAVRRLMSAADSVFYHANANGQAYMVESIAADKKRNDAGKPLNTEERRSYIQNVLFDTDTKLKEIRKSVEARRDTLKKAGIQMSDNEVELAIYEQAERARAERTREMSARAGDKGVFINDPEGVIGAIVAGIQTTTNKVKVPIGGKEVKPFEFVFPFLRTPANVANSFLDHTPVGFFRAVSKNKKSTPEVDRSLEARQQAGQALIGTTLLAGFFGLAHAFKDDEDPFIAFFGNYPKGKMKEWQERGIPTYSIKIGDSYIGLQNTPLALLPAIIGGSISSIQKGESPEKVIFNASIAATGALATMTSIKQMGELFGAITQAEGPTTGSTKGSFSASNLGSSLLSNQLSGFVPASALLKNMGKWMNQSPTETYDNFTAKMLGGMPYAQSLGIGEPKLNMFGEPIVSNFFERAGIQSMINMPEPDKVVKWLATSGFKVSEPGPVMKLSKGEQEMFAEARRETYQDVLTPAESREVLKIAGPQIKKELEALMVLPEFKIATKENQSMINEIVNSIRAQAKYEVLSKTK